MSRGNEETGSGLFLCMISEREKRRLCSAICPCCGETHSVPIRFPSGRKHAVRKLSQSFNICYRCGKFVCDDCYVITSGDKSIEGVCRICAKELSIAGKTTTEIISAFTKG